MVIVSPPVRLARQTPDWQQQLQQAISDPLYLLQILKLEHLSHTLSAVAAEQFRLRVPLAYVARMRRGDAHDPLLRQVLPIRDEEVPASGFSDDPVADLGYSKTPGLIHKYHGRVLLIITGGCAINCRYCFRRAFPYSDNSISGEHLQACLRYIADHADIHEVIFSGGDPLLLATHKLQSLAAAVLAIDHVQQLRIHTRLPVVLPDRIDAELCNWISKLPQAPVIVLHCNHANEIDEALTAACQRLRAAGAVLLNQTVLLQGVNDSSTAQIALAQALFQAGVLPYYLHQLDKVTGSSHFLVSDQQALDIHASMRHRLSGYLLPRLVRDEPGKTAKTELLTYS